MTYFKINSEKIDVFIGSLEQINSEGSRYILKYVVCSLILLIPFPPINF